VAPAIGQSYPEMTKPAESDTRVVNSSAESSNMSSNQVTTMVKTGNVNQNAYVMSS
jgi:hypothetical protein